MLCPFLPVTTEYRFGGWWLGPLGRYAGSWPTAQFEASVRTYAGAFRDGSGRRIERAALLASETAGVDGELLSPRERRALQAAVDLGFLSCNPVYDPDGDNEGWTTVTSDHTEIFFQPISPDGHLALGRGLIVEIVSAGHRFDDGLTLGAPLEVYLPMSVRGDEDVMRAAYEVFRGAHDDVDAAFARRLLLATDWLSKAWRNTPSIRWEDRIVLLKTGFEALTNTSKTHEEARWLRSLFERVLVDETDDSTDEILWSPGESETMTYTWGGNRIEHVTPLQHWFHGFGNARNAIIHGDESWAMVYEEDTAYRGLVVYVAQRLLVEALKVVFADFGYLDAWEPRIRRMIRRGLEQRLAGQRAPEDEA